MDSRTIYVNEFSQPLEIPNGYRQMTGRELVKIDCMVIDEFDITWKDVEETEIGLQAWSVSDIVITKIK